MQLEHFRKLKELVEVAYADKPHLFSGSSGPHRTTNDDLVLIHLGHVYHVRYVNGPSPDTNTVYTVGITMNGGHVEDILINSNDVPLSYSAGRDEITEFRGAQVHDRVIALFDKHFTETE